MRPNDITILCTVGQNPSVSFGRAFSVNPTLRPFAEVPGAAPRILCRGPKIKGACVAAGLYHPDKVIGSAQLSQVRQGDPGTHAAAPVYNHAMETVSGNTEYREHTSELPKRTR